MAPRLNKNGIPILDDPRRASRLQRAKCLPDEHDYVKYSEREPSLLTKETVYRCSKCGEIDTQTVGSYED